MVYTPRQAEHEGRKLNLLNAIDAKCPFCNLEEESIQQLFLHCPYSWGLWSEVLGWWNIQTHITDTREHWMELWCGTIEGSFRGKLWFSLHYVVLWSIWYVRNIMAFEKVKTNRVHELYQIKLRLRFWMKGWGTDCAYNLGELVSNLEGVSLSRGIKHPGPM